MTTPNRAWPLWVTANLSLIALLPAYALWLSRIAHEGSRSGVRLPTDADSIGIPLYGLAIHYLWALPLLNILIIWILHRYPGRVALFQPIRLSGAIRTVKEGIFGVAMIGMVVLVLDSFIEADWELGVILLPWLYLILAMRAVVLAKERPSASSV